MSDRILLANSSLRLYYKARLDLIYSLIYKKRTHRHLGPKLLS